MQAMLIRDEESFPKEYSPQINKIFDQLENFKDDDGYYYWAKDKKGLSDNSLITATMSILLSLTARHERSFSIDTSKWEKENRYEFIGNVCENMRKKYRYKSAEHYWKSGNRNPIKYSY